MKVSRAKSYIIARGRRNDFASEWKIAKATRRAESVIPIIPRARSLRSRGMPAHKRAAQGGELAGVLPVLPGISGLYFSIEFYSLRMGTGRASAWLGSDEDAALTVSIYTNARTPTASPSRILEFTTLPIFLSLCLRERRLFPYLTRDV